MTRLAMKSAVTKPIRVSATGRVVGSEVDYREHFKTPGCTVVLETAVDDGEWTEVDNGDEVPGVHSGCVVRGRVTLHLAKCTHPEPNLDFDLYIRVSVDSDGAR